MKLTVHISQTIRAVARELPDTMVVEKPESVTIRQLAVTLGIPPILIAFTVVDDVKRGLDEEVPATSDIYFFGTVAGG
jgi:hypothetical protein